MTVLPGSTAPVRTSDERDNQTSSLPNMSYVFTAASPRPGGTELLVLARLLVG
jgi:hypothetical protein